MPLLTLAPSETTELMPINALSPIVAPLMTAPCPMETLLPISTGGLNSLDAPTMALSWTFTPLPIDTGWCSPVDCARQGVMSPPGEVDP